MNPFALWLKETRERHHISQEKLVDAINAWAQAEGMTWTLHRPNYVGWERGKGITDPLRDRLIAYWVAQGEPEPDLTPVQPTPAVDPVAAAIDRQTAVVSELVEELRLARMDRVRLDSVERAVLQLLTELDPPRPTVARSQEPRAPRETAESGR